MRGRSATGLAAVLAVLMALAAPGLARAQEPVTLDGSPLNVTVNGIGGLQVRFDNALDGEFCCGPDDTENGFALRSANGAVSVRGAGATSTQAPEVSGPDANGNLTATSHYDVSTLNGGSPDLTVHVDETVTYTNDTNRVRVQLKITNPADASSPPVSFTVGELADLYAGGSDHGTGVYDAEAPRFIGGVAPAGGADGLEEVPDFPWSGFEEAEYDNLFEDFGNGELTSQALSADVDNEVGAEWSVENLAGQQTRTINLIWRFDAQRLPAPVITSPANGSVMGSAITFQGTAPPNAFVYVFSPDAFVQSDPVQADAAGNWSLQFPALDPGTYSFQAIATNPDNDATSYESSPVTLSIGGSPTPTPTPVPTPVPPPPPPTTTLPPPVVGKSVNAQTKSGKIRIRLPGTHKYILLGPGQQIPTGTTVDSRKGRITLTTAVGGGATQHADFYRGVFRVTQSHGHKPLTTLSLAGRKPTCGKKRHKKAHHATAARKGKHKKHKKRVKSRRLWGSGHGSFRTKGKYSSATVRGTTWLTQDTCAGTLTRVTHGVVQVRDFVRHKKKLVRAGHRYLARAKRHHHTHR